MSYPKSKRIRRRRRHHEMWDLIAERIMVVVVALSALAVVVTYALT